MTATFTDEQEELRRYVREWLDDRAPLEQVRKVMETEAGFDTAQWAELGDLGWLGMAVPEEHGGAGYGFSELAILAEEMGRTLYPSPFLSSVVLGATAVEHAATPDERADLLPRVASGDLRLSLAVTERHSEWTFGAISTTARREGDDWIVDGTKDYVLDGHTADVLVVAAGTEHGPALMLVERDAPGVTTDRLPVMDLTRPLATVTLDGARGRRLGEGDAEEAVAAAVDRGVAALGMEQVGGAQACLDMSVAYAKDRHQFGRAIGSFQAVKHMCADMLVMVESARSAAYHLARAVDDAPDEVAIAAPLTKACASETFVRCASDAIQIHGGIGFTWEHDAHLYLKRAKSSERLFGSPQAHRAVLAGRLGM